MRQKEKVVKGVTFAEAVKKISNIAGGRYHSIKFGMTIHGSGNFGNGRTTEVSCELYMEGKNHVYGQTWEEAFENLAALDSDPADPMEMAPVGNPHDAAEF